MLLFAGAGFHFWRVRRAGGVVVPPDAVRDERGKPEQVLFLPHLLWRETAVALLLLAAVSLFSALVRAPLGPPANPGLSLNPAKAPWYFLGFQELLVHLHPLFAVVVVPALGALALVALPYLGFPKDEPRGAWFLSANGRRTARLAAVVALVATPLLVVADAALLGASGAPAGRRRARDPRPPSRGRAPRRVRRGLPPPPLAARRHAPRGGAGALRLPRDRRSPS